MARLSAGDGPLNQSRELRRLNTEARSLYHWPSCPSLSRFAPPVSLLRPWRSEDAAASHPIHKENWAHLGPWIPARIATPAPIPVLAERLSGFGADFAAGQERRYVMIKSDDDEVLGEVGLFPRSATGRVHYADADRVELGYRLRADATGRGFVTEGAHAMLAVAAALPHVSCVEVRCERAQRAERGDTATARLRPHGDDRGTRLLHGAARRAAGVDEGGARNVTLTR